MRHHVADLDLVAISLDAVSSSVVDRFLLSHYHVAGPGVPKFMIQLVDPVAPRSTWEGVGVFFVKDGKIKEWSDYTIRMERG